MPNIVELYSFGELDGESFVAREFVDGGSITAGLSGIAKHPERVAVQMGIVGRASIMPTFRA